MGWNAEEGFESWLKSSVADMSVVRPVLHVSLNRLRADTASFTSRIRYKPSIAGLANYRAYMSPEGESIKPDDEDVDDEDLGLDKTEGGEIPIEENDDEEG